MTETKEIEKKMVTFELQGEEFNAFELAFDRSGFRSRSEFIRYLLKYGIQSHKDIFERP